MTQPVLPRWDEMHYRLVSLWDIMEQIPANEFLRALNRIAHVAHTTVFGRFLSLPEADFESQRTAIATVLDVARRLDLVATEEAASAYSEVIERGGRPNPGFVTYSIVDAGRLKDLGNDVCGRASAEMRGRVVLVIPRAKGVLFQQTEPPFGADVANNFRSANDDIAEAGKCLALARGTACVMHLNRAQEVVLRALAKAMGIGTQNDWGAYIRTIETELDNRMKAAGKRTPDEQFYSEAVTAFDNVKRAWRNPTMHPEKDYSPERAQEIFDAVRSFMRHLATKISE
jgi:hypothetical protein